MVLNDLLVLNLDRLDFLEKRLDLSALSDVSFTLHLFKLDFGVSHLIHRKFLLNAILLDLCE